MAKRSLRDCRIIVTGASSGIGRALAVELAGHGARLVLVARRREKLVSLTAEIADPQQVDAVVGDVAESSTRRQALDTCQRNYGGLDILVNNAGVGALGRFEDATPDRLRRIMEVNFFAAAEFAREAFPLLRQGRDPLLVNVSSILGHRAAPRNSEYCASKFALQGLSESLRAEWTRHGIGVLVVSPGSTRTEFGENLLEDQIEAPLPSRPHTSAEEVAKLAVRAMQRRRNEVVPSFTGRLLLWANRIAPRAVDRAMNRYA